MSQRVDATRSTWENALVQAEPAMNQNVYYQPQQAMMMMPQMMSMPFGGQFYQQPMIAQHVGYQAGHRIPSPPQHGGPLPNNYGMTQNTPVSAGTQDFEKGVQKWEK